ncbi:hypothetical protein D3C71_1737920 [compost metagenome]
MAVKPPSSVVTVIVAVPAAFAVTTPSSSTVTISSSLLLQMTFGFAASSGSMIAVRLMLPPVARLNSVRFTLTPVTGIISGSGSVTVTSA